MDSSNSEAETAKKFEDDKNYYKVPTNLFEFIPTIPDGRRVLNVNEPDLLQYRKYRPGENDTKYFCSGCYFKHGLKNYPYFLDGSLFAPHLHSCEFIATSKKDSEIINVKVEANDGNNVAASAENGSSTSVALQSGVITSLLNSTESRQTQQPPPRIIDIIFLDDDEINPEYEDETPPTTNDKLESEFRSVGPELYERGYSKQGKKGIRVIVFEGPENNRVRQYAGNRNDSWFCIGCFSKSKKHVRAFFEDEIFVVPKMHFCDSISYAEAKKEQNKIVKKWNIKEQVAASEGNDVYNDLDEESSIRSHLRTETPENSQSKSSKIQIPSEQYIFGVGPKNQENGRLFVFDNNDKTYGREYNKGSGNSYYCRVCNSFNKKRRWALLKKNGLNIASDHICLPKSFAEFQNEQESIKAKYDSILHQNNVNPAATVNIPGPLRRRTQTPTYYNSPSTLAVNTISSSKTQIYSRAAATPPPPSAAIYSEEKDNSSSAQNACRPPRNQHQTKFAASGPSRRRTRTPVYYPSTVAAADIPGSSKIPIYSRAAAATSPPPLSPIHVYSEAQVRRRSTPDVLFLCARTPDAPVAGSFRTPIYSRSAATSPLPTAPKYSEVPIRRRNTPDAPVSQIGVKRKVGRPRKNVDSGAFKRAKPAQIDHNLDESIEESEEDDTRLQRIKATENFILNKTNIYSSSVDKHKSQKFDNPSTTVLSNVSTLVNHHPSPPKQQVLYSSKIPPPSTFASSHRTPVATNSALKMLFNKVLSSKTSSSNPSTTAKLSTPILSTPSTTPISSSSSNLLATVNNSTPILSTPSTTPLSSSTPIPFLLSDHTSTVKWYRPSSFILEKCCEKLDLVYSDEAYNIWMQIKIDKISPTSSPDYIFTTNEEIYFGWECISLFFTGKEDKAFYIREKINEHIYRENSKSINPVDRKEEEKLLFSKSITVAHLKSISQLFECRIGIFAENKWTKYGNWSTSNSDILTLLMEKKDGKYFPILNLK